jgi:ATP-binding cassette, subfamily B, bacterial
MSFPHLPQKDAMSCGPACVQMIAKFYGRSFALEKLSEYSNIGRQGISMLGMSQAAERIGFRTRGVKIDFETLKKDAPLPCIVHWNQNHFVVVYKITRKKVYVSDPAAGRIGYSHQEFLARWATTQVEDKPAGIALLLEPTPEFYAETDDENAQKRDFSFLLRYLRPYKSLLLQLVLGLLAGSLLQLIFPFLTQSLVDYGIGGQNMGFIHLVLIAQLVLFLSRLSVDFIRGWILLHVSTRINISLISDFLIKLMKLPIGFFDTKLIGDLMQRISDHRRIEDFLTGSMLNIVFAALTFLVFGIVLIIYNLTIFAVFVLFTALYIIWVLLFMRKRRELDHKMFGQMSDNQGQLIQIIHGIQEIKLNNCEKSKRWDWEQVQARLFRINRKRLALSQYQQAGAFFFNEGKNIFITFLAAKLVLEGQLTLGMMLAIQYILGQLNAPVEQMIGFLHAFQDAKISFERMSEIHNKSDETQVQVTRMSELPANRTLYVQSLDFKYPGADDVKVLKSLDLEIPESKITAIVGASGSGKTTLVKLLLGFYPPLAGEIKVGNYPLQGIDPATWRSKCGVVMQDGFIFSDTIAGNITMSDSTPAHDNLQHALKVANIEEYVNGLPLGLNTKIGQEGVGLSQGQKQRLLIARAVYKDPDYLFFDEATNALDANNEKIIMEQLNQFFKGRTVVIVAHRLSTVKNADQIVVLDKGKIIEKGTHQDLTALKGAYYQLVKNQLELGN